MTASDDELVEVPLAVLAFVWGGTVAAVAAMDVYANRRRDGSTLSMFVRRAFRTETQPGRVAFVGAWAALSGWFVPHICRQRRVVAVADPARAGGIRVAEDRAAGLTDVLSGSLL
jgi:hypothetical protein